MQVKELKTASQLKKFVSMADGLYKNDPFYVPYMRGDLLKTLKLLVLKNKTYRALAVENGGKYIARILVTVAPDKHLGISNCGYFSHFECVNDFKVSRMIFSEACKILAEAGASYIQGPYFPYDQDNRRGLLVKGFEYEPMILTSYNPPYYADLLEDCGFEKHADTYSYALSYDRYDVGRIQPLTEKLKKRYGLYVRAADFSKIDREIDDVYSVIIAADKEEIYQSAPSRADIERIVKGWRAFLWEKLILICRRESDDKPVGVMMAIPNYFTVFRKMKGRTNPVALVRALYYRSRIRSVRAMLQYVIPEYQNHGVNFMLYHEFYKTCKNSGITAMEAGTIMENNYQSCRNVEKVSGILNKIFRIYGKRI